MKNTLRVALHPGNRVDIAEGLVNDLSESAATNPLVSHHPVDHSLPGHNLL